MKHLISEEEIKLANEWFNSLIYANQIQLAWLHFQTRYPSKLSDEHRVVMYRKNQEKFKNYEK